jgi:hypothetical protein
MNYLLLLIPFVIIIVIWWYCKSSLTPIQQTFLNNTLQPILDQIDNLKIKYDPISKVIPGQIILSITPDGKASTSIFKEPIPSGIDFTDIINLGKQLDQLYTKLISTATNSKGIYTPSQLQAFITYYTIQQTNVETVLKYCSE